MGMIISTPSGGGAVDLSFITATADKILEGYSSTNSNGEQINGSMVNHGAKTASLNAGDSYIIPIGYHNGSGKITANSLASQTSANAIATDILAGKTAWVNGVKINGSMVNQGIGKAALNSGINDKGLYYYFDQGYYPTDGYGGAWIYQDLASVRRTIGYTNAAKVLNDTTIAGLKGSMVNRGAWSSGLGINGRITIPAGYHNGGGYVNQSIPTQGGQTITPNASQQTVSCSGKYMTGNIVVNAIPSNLVDLNVNQDLFRNGLYGNCAVGAKVLFDKTSGQVGKYGAAFFSGVVNGNMTFTIQSTDGSSSTRTSELACDVIWFKKKVDLTNYPIVEMELYGGNGLPHIGIRPTFIFSKDVPKTQAQKPGYTGTGYMPSLYMNPNVNDNWNGYNDESDGRMGGTSNYNNLWVRFEPSLQKGWRYLGFTINGFTGVSDTTSVKNGAQIFIKRISLLIA